jgi:hypothetical protein
LNSIRASCPDANAILAFLEGRGDPAAVESQLPGCIPLRAVPILERALELPCSPHAAARVRFELARALWDSRRDRARARSLATDARARYASLSMTNEESARVTRWLEAHR